MTIWDLRKSNTLTHNHNYLMGTITFEVHPIIPTSPKNTLATIFKSILILFILIFFAYFFFLSISCIDIRERERERERERRNIQLCYSPISPCVVSFLSLYTCFLLSVCNLLFLFHTKMLWWVFFKVFQKYKLSKSTFHKLSSCKVSQEFVLG